MPEPRPRPDDGPARTRGRSVPAIYGIVSLVLVIGAVTFALSTPPPSTPPLAAVAPAPQEQLEVERVEQSSQFGEGTGGEGDCVPGDPGCDAAAPASTAEEQAVPEQGPGPEQGEPDVAESRPPVDRRRCVNGPGGPRQTEDPQSPPCTAEIFDGDNGGATSAGVTAASVRLVVPFEQEDAEVDHRRVVEALVAHFNDRYEFHGRQLEVEFVDLADEEYDTPAQARAFAGEIAAREPFATLDIESSAPAFYRELAARGVIVTSGLRSRPIHGLDGSAELDPYLWFVHPSLSSSLRSVGDLACTALVGQVARHAGDPVLAQTPRHFGVFAQATDHGRIDAEPVASRLSACGASFDVYLQDDSDRASTELVLRRMREDGVTTVVCACAQFKSVFTHVAEEIGYRPEWLLADDETVGDQPTSRYHSDHVDAQQRHAFGVTPRLRRPGGSAGGARQQHEDQYWFHAMAAHDSGIAFTSADLSKTFYDYYAQLLVLASGIQHAGPELTPEAFGDALVSLRHPNPGVGAHPWFQPSVGFGASDRGFNSDWAVWWLDLPEEWGERSKTARNQLKALPCYLGDGIRFTVGTFPADADEKFFDPEAGCR